MQTFDRIIVLSDEERRYLAKIGLNEIRTRKIPVAINDIFFTNSHPTRRESILYVGRIDPYKGLKVLLNAVKEVNKTASQLKCIIIGKDYGYRGELEKMISDSGIQNYVEIRDYVQQKDLLDLYSSALVSILLSSSEGMPLSIIESMALGVPFVATEVGAITELAEASGAGILVPTHEPKAVADAILGVHNDKDLWSKLSVNGKKYALNFTWADVGKRYHDLYLELTK
jgi:glycosyltransferase involved in cell wall biosynthesis